MARKGKDESNIQNESAIPEVATLESKTKPQVQASDSGFKLKAEDQNEQKQSAFIDRIYKEINDVIGGNNPQQFFSLCFPGTALEKSQYSYDVAKNEMKPSFVEANESKLVNKLFDAARVNAGDNGRHLQTQYKTALDMLTPRLNATLFKAKTQLRKVLMTPYPYDFGDGKGTTNLTLQQVFFRLYNEYVQAKEKWSEAKAAERNRLEREYPGKSKETNQKRQNKYLDWYSSVAEAQELLVEEKLGKVLNVFSPGDMEIINGILESGAGRELSEARAVLSNVEKRNPDGGRVYPVNLYPENWFEYLDTSFTPIDLLESTSALSQKMSVLSRQRTNLQMQLQAMAGVILSADEIDRLKSGVKEAEEAYQNALEKFHEDQSNITKDAVMALVDVVSALPTKKEISESGKEKDVSAIHDDTVLRVLDVDEKDMKDGEAVSNFVRKILDGLSECQTKQAELDQAAINATTSAMEYIEKNNLTQYRSILLPLKTHLDRVTDEIDALKQKINLSYHIQDSDLENNKGVQANAVPDGYTQLVLSTTVSNLDVSSTSSANAAKSVSGLSFIFGGYHESKDSSDANHESFSLDENTTIDIGMSVAKVNIGREWFNPGVFLLSKDMYNTSNLKISPSVAYNSFDDERLNEMNRCVFPCFPVAFVIGRDISIKFSTGTSMNTSFAKSVEKHSASGGGFFIFGGSQSSSSSASSSATSVSSSENSVAIRFTTPQILGYYLEATPADRSTPIDSKISAQDDSMSIFEFITAFQDMLNTHNQKYHHQSLNLL